MFASAIAAAVTIDPPAGAEGRNALDFSGFSAAVTINLGLDTPQAIGNGLTITLQDPAAINAFIDTPFDDNIIGNGADDFFAKALGLMP